MSVGVRSAAIRWSRAICKEPENYLGWPAIAQKADGELLVVFSGDREGHVCPYGKTQLVRSRDRGETWTEPETITNSPLDDRDAGIVVLQSGVVVVSWFTASCTPEYLDRFRDLHPPEVLRAWKRHAGKISDDERRQWHGHLTRRSTDGGKTWGPAVQSIASSPLGPIELRDGRLLYVGTGFGEWNGQLVSVESTDEGRSWRLIGIVPPPSEFAAIPAEALNEPHCVELPDGRIVCLWRFEPASRPYDEWHLHQSESADGGRTWTIPERTVIWGHPPHLIRLLSGALLATYGYRRPPYGQRACLSHDGGRTWDIAHEIVLRADAPDGDLGYPASIELELGELLTVYYQVDQPGEKTCLMATRWSLSELAP
jgi:sialidase-1